MLADLSTAPGYNGDITTDKPPCMAHEDGSNIETDTPPHATHGYCKAAAITPCMGMLLLKTHRHGGGNHPTDTPLLTGRGHGGGEHTTDMPLLTTTDTALARYHAAPTNPPTHRRHTSI